MVSVTARGTGPKVLMSQVFGKRASIGFCQGLEVPFALRLQVWASNLDPYLLLSCLCGGVKSVGPYWFTVYSGYIRTPD